MKLQSRRQALSPHRLRGLVIGAAITIGIIIGANAVVLAQLHQNTLREVQTSLLRQSLTLSELVERTYQSADLVLSSVADDIRIDALTDKNLLQLVTQKYHIVLKEKIAGQPQIDTLGVLDAEGRRLNHSRDWPNQIIDLSYREYFQALKKSPKIMAFVDKPMQGSASGAWVTIIARPVLAANGKFLGAVFASTSLKYFENLFRATSLGDGYASTLMRSDGTLLARYPLAGHIGTVAPASVLKRLTSSRSGVSSSISPIDHQARIAAAHSLLNYPLVVVATQNERDAFAAWRTTAFTMTSIAAVMVFMIIIAALLIARSWNQQDRLNAARDKIIESGKNRALAELELKRQRDLATQTARFNAAVENMSQGLCMFDATQRLIVCNKRYAELYGLSDEQTKSGTELRVILRDRVARGNAPDDHESYINDRISEVAANKPYQVTNRLSDGRYVSVVHRPMKDGGWVATHEDITEARRREESFRLLFDANPMPMWVTDRESLRFLAVNEAAVKHYGYSREQFMMMTIVDLFPSEDSDRLERHLRALPEIQFIENIGQHRKADGAIIDVSVLSRALNYGDHQARLAVIQDITKVTLAESELRRTKKFLDTVIEHVPLPIIVKDVAGLSDDARDSRFTLFNRAYEDLTGESRVELVGKTAHQLFPKERADLIVQSDNEALWSDRVVLTSEHQINTAQNGLRLVVAKKTVVRDENANPQYLLTVVDDVTDRRRAEERIAYLAHTDSLTGLPNRGTFVEYLTATLDKASKCRDQVAILCLDLDRFKEANDAYGHLIGDGLLRETARRLQTAAGSTFLARVGGDEFTLVMNSGLQPATAEALGERLLSAFQDSFDVDGHRLQLGLSIGGAVYPSDGTNAKSLMANADAALYQAKAEARGSVRFFEAELGARLRDRRELQNDLRAAINRGNLFLHYQPQQKLTSNETIGFESLVRWQCSKRGLVAPSKFIPIAEECGLIIPLGEWILREACREAASWPQPLSIAVNISPIQFRHGDLPRLVHSILLETGLAPNRLELEITEGVLIDDFSRAISILHKLKSLGVQIAMDDFGSGYSSLSYLHSFSFDKIKIDRCFIGDLEHNHHSMAIVRAIITLGHSLDVPILAEGVESEAQRSFLMQEGCDEVQGYLFGRPLPIRDYCKLVGRQEAAPQYFVATS